MLPYFVFGLMCLKKKPMYLNWSIGLACGTLYLMAVFLLGDSSVNGMNFWKVNAHWKVVFSSWGELVPFFARTAVGICGSIFVLFVVNMLCRVLPNIKVLSSLGMSTLGVYVIHEYPLCVLGSINTTLLPLPSFLRWPMAIAYLLLCHSFIVLLKHFSLTNVVFFGNENFMSDTLRRVCGTKPAI